MTIFGWDMSHYDAPGIGNAVTAGISFITHKAGGDANDTELASWWAGVKGLDPEKVLLGAYWVLYPGSPAAKADAFIARLDAVCSGWRDRPFLLQVDCEEWSGDSSTIPSVSQINTFCDRLVAVMPKLRPVGYLPDWVYGDISAFKYTLWSSKYVTGSGSFKSLYPGDSASEWSSYGGKSPSILQYTSNATIAGQTTCDANAYRGTLAQLIALVAPGWETDVALSTDDINKLAAATATAIAAMTDFPKGGGQHSKVGDGVLNSSYPKAPGADRTYVWANLQDLQTGVTAINAGVSSLIEKIGADPADQDAFIASALAGLPAERLAKAFAAAGITGDTIAAAVPVAEAKKAADALAIRLKNA